MTEGKTVKVSVILRLDDGIEGMEVGSATITEHEDHGAAVAELLRRCADEAEAVEW